VAQKEPHKVKQKMFNHKFLIACLLTTFLFVALSLPATFALEYTPGVTTGQYVKYGNFIGNGPGVESFNDYNWLKIEITSVSGNEVTLFSTGQFRNGTAIPGNGTTTVWNVEAGTEHGIQSTQGPIIAANLNQGDAIPPLNTYTLNRTEDRTYLGIRRTINILNVVVSTPDYNNTATYVYDKVSGMLAESSSITVTQAQPEPVTSEFAYSITETNIFGLSMPSPSPTIAPSQSATSTPTTQTTSTSTPALTSQASLSPQPSSSGGLSVEYIAVAIAVIIVVVTVVAALALRKRTKLN
jgi:hypothetical protein